MAAPQRTVQGRGQLESVKLRREAWGVMRVECLVMDKIVWDEEKRGTSTNSEGLPATFNSG